MIALWKYHWRMGRTVEWLFRLAEVDRVVGADAMMEMRGDVAVFRGEQWSDAEIAILRGRGL